MVVESAFSRFHVESVEFVHLMNSHMQPVTRPDLMRGPLQLKSPALDVVDISPLLSFIAEQQEPVGIGAEERTNDDG